MGVPNINPDAFKPRFFEIMTSFAEEQWRLAVPNPTAVVVEFARDLLQTLRDTLADSAAGDPDETTIDYVRQHWNRTEAQVWVLYPKVFRVAGEVARYRRDRQSGQSIDGIVTDSLAAEIIAGEDGAVTHHRRVCILPTIRARDTLGPFRHSTGSAVGPSHSPDLLTLRTGAWP